MPGWLCSCGMTEGALICPDAELLLAWLAESMRDERERVRDDDEGELVSDWLTDDSLL